MPESRKEEVRVHKHEKIETPEQMKCTTLTPLKLFFEGFSLVCIDTSILLIAGGNSNGAKGKCHAFNTVSGSWDTVKLP